LYPEKYEFLSHVGGKYSTVTAVLSVASRCRYSRSSQSMNKPFQSFKRPSTAYGPEAAALHRVAADLWLVTAVWCGEFAHAQRRLWKPKSVSGVERLHFSAASAVGQHHVIQLASDWLHLSF